MKKNIALNILMGVRLKVLLKLIFTYGISLHPLYFLRFLLLIPNALLSEIFIVVEKIKFGAQIRQTSLKDSPVFIVGHWRSGTTFLHQLIALDPQFTVPTLVQTVIPSHFLFFSRYYVPIMRKMMPPKRPMDEIRMNPNDPMEDEFALIKMGSHSPFLKLLFPSRKSPFLSKTSDFIPVDDVNKWKNRLHLFLLKITCSDPRRILLKNPFHTPRLSLLKEMYPEAKFIYIVRHPYNVVPSAINMWHLVADENALNSQWRKPNMDTIMEVIDYFDTAVAKFRETYTDSALAVIRYEDLEQHPEQELQRLYDQLNLNFSSEFHQKIIAFIQQTGVYKKNRFELSYDEKKRISTRLERYFTLYYYQC